MTLTTTEKEKMREMTDQVKRMIFEMRATAEELRDEAKHLKKLIEKLPKKPTE
jgi:methyl-accepting chemotaxis protein